MCKPTSWITEGEVSELKQGVNSGFSIAEHSLGYKSTSAVARRYSAVAMEQWRSMYKSALETPASEDPMESKKLLCHYVMKFTVQYVVFQLLGVVHRCKKPALESNGIGY